eukprot:435073-Pelagomonas_calceolata.AAC.7
MRGNLHEGCTERVATMMKRDFSGFCVTCPVTRLCRVHRAAEERRPNALVHVLPPNPFRLGDSGAHMRSNERQNIQQRLLVHALHPKEQPLIRASTSPGSTSAHHLSGHLVETCGGKVHMHYTSQPERLQHKASGDSYQAP